MWTSHIEIWGKVVGITNCFSRYGVFYLELKSENYNQKKFELLYPYPQLCLRNGGMFDRVTILG